MPQLPEDVLFLIVKQLQQLHRQDHPKNTPLWHQPKLSQYAGINRTFNAIIERETFQHVHVYSEALTAPCLSPGEQGNHPAHSTTPARFKQMMNRDLDRRRAILRRVSFLASHEFPLNSDEARSEVGGAANNQHFSQSIRQFWEVLEGLEKPGQRKFILEFDSLSVSAPVFDSEHHPGRESHLHLVGNTLPQLSCVSGFEFRRGLRIWPSSLLQIMASMKSLTRADLRFHNMIEDPEQRRQYRKDLGTCISQLPASCLELNAVFADASHGFDEHPAVTPHTPDTLCIGIRDLSTRLRHLSLDAVRVSPAIFWPADVEQQQQPPSWPHLEVLELILEPVDSYGTFYADPTPSEIAYNAANHTPARPIESITRLVPRPERGLHQLVTAAGRAAFRGGGMPRLRELRVELPDKCGLAVELFFGQDWKGEGNFRLEWTSRPPVPWTDEIVEAWGIEWKMCEIDSEEADEDGDGGYWNLEAMVPCSGATAGWRRD